MVFVMNGPNSNPSILCWRPTTRLVIAMYE